MRNLAILWKDRYPDENINSDYMKDNLDRDHNGFAFIANAVIKGNVIKGASRIPKAVKAQSSCVMHGCYYNSMDFMHRFGAQYPKMKLAYGMAVDPRTFDEIKKFANIEPGKMLQVNSQVIRHGFLTDGKKIYDPTLGASKDYFFYEIIPESVWRKFNYKADDSNWDARDFANYIHARIDKLQAAYPLEKKLKAIGGI